MHGQISLDDNQWKHMPIVAGSEIPRTLGLGCLRGGYPRKSWGYEWAFDIATGEECLVLPISQGCLKSQDVVGLLKVPQQHVLMTTKIVSQKQCQVSWDAGSPIRMQKHCLKE